MPSVKFAVVLYAAIALSVSIDGSRLTYSSKTVITSSDNKSYDAGVTSSTGVGSAEYLPSKCVEYVLECSLNCNGEKGRFVQGDRNSKLLVPGGNTREAQVVKFCRLVNEEYGEQWGWFTNKEGHYLGAKPSQKVQFIPGEWTDDYSWAKILNIKALTNYKEDTQILVGNYPQEYKEIHSVTIKTKEYSPLCMATDMSGFYSSRECWVGRGNYMNAAAFRFKEQHNNNNQPLVGVKKTTKDKVKLVTKKIHGHATPKFPSFGIF